MNTRYQNRASTNVNQQQLIDNQNKVQSQNQPIVNAPVDPNTGLSTPLEPVVQPAPVPTQVTPAPTPVTPETATQKQDATP